MSNLRRFYLDNGKSRKRWQVSVRGKLQVVEYGRIGGALRQASKSFDSPQQAALHTDHLISTKVREGYVEVDPALLEITRIKGRRGATEKQIQAFEKSLGCELPTEYRNFLATCNGGRPNPPYVQIPGMEGIDNVGVSEIFGLVGTETTDYSLAWARKVLGPSFPSGYLPIAYDSDVFTLSLNKKTFGCIHFWFHETDEIDDDERFLESASHLLASSFDEFLTRIATMFGALGDQDDKPQDKSSKVKASLKTLFQLFNHEHTAQVVQKIEGIVGQLGDLSVIEDGQWPFNNIDSVRLLKCLLEAGLNPEILDTEGNSLLWQCTGSAECVDLLLQYGVEVDRRSSSYKETALMRALFVQSVPGVKRLLQAGARPNVRLPWYIKSNVKYHDEISKMLAHAIEKWKANKVKAKRS